VGKVIETHEHAGRVQRAVRPQAKAYLGTILIGAVLVLVGVGFVSEGPKHIPAVVAYAAGAVLILLTILLVIWLVRNR
jgi:protein-S-isoprenylcysteine O-methyltransferase Ste14